MFLLSYSQPVDIGLQDGIWKFEIQYLDPFLRLSNPHEQIVTFDSNPPVAYVWTADANEMETKFHRLPLMMDILALKFQQLGPFTYQIRA